MISEMRGIALPVGPFNNDRQVAATDQRTRRMKQLSADYGSRYQPQWVSGSGMRAFTELMARDHRLSVYRNCYHVISHVITYRGQAASLIDDFLIPNYIINLCLKQ